RTFCGVDFGGFVPNEGEVVVMSQLSGDAGLSATNSPSFGAKQSGRGRPPAASRDMLQDAAFELFLENGYAGTTVEQIAQRAGGSRNTFFTYFGAKGDVFWVELDEAAASFDTRLASVAADAAPLPALLDAVLEVVADFGPSHVPFALTQAELMG